MSQQTLFNIPPRPEFIQKSVTELSEIMITTIRIHFGTLQKLVSEVGEDFPGYAQYCDAADSTAAAVLCLEAARDSLKQI